MTNSLNINKLNSEYEKKSPKELLRWALGRYSPKIALASSFGAEDVVLIDMLYSMDPKVTIFTLDTGRLNEETYEVMDRIRSKYGISIKSYFPDANKVEALERTKGFFSFKESIENRKECCGIRKVEPLNRALKGLEALITGLRRGQSVTSTEVKKTETDEAHQGILKINPLADWTNDQVWDYIRKNKVPYNRLHDAG